MFKNQSTKRKSKHKLLSEINNQESNFKNQSITINQSDISFNKLIKIQDFKGLPEKNQQIRIITKKLINTFDFISFILQNEVISEMYITTYRIGKKAIIQLSKEIDCNKIKKLSILICDNLPKFAPDVYNNLVKMPKTKILIDNVHAKIFLAKTEKNYYVIEGSGNLTINGRIEQYTFDNNKQIYDFHKNWIDAI